MAKQLSEQVVVITGASSGIGRETALRLAGKGAKVVVSARRDEALDELVQEIRDQGGEAISIPADVSDMKDVQSLAKGTMKTYGRIDTWVNNAGVLLVGEFENTNLDEAHRVMNVNFWGEYNGCKAVLPIMKEQGEGTIINISSVTARRPLPLMSIYSASKAAINGLSEALRAELADTNIQLSIVMPATIDTPLFEHGRTKEGLAPKATPPIYPPSEVARAIEMCAVSPRRVVYAGPAGLGFAISNSLMGGVLDFVLGKVRRPAVLSNEPEPARGHDNLNRPMRDAPPSSTGGWRTSQYKAFEICARVAMGLAALLVARKFVKRT